MLKYILIVSLLMTTLTGHSESRIAVNPYGKYYSDSLGLIGIEMAFFRDKNESGNYDVIVIPRGLLAYQHNLDGKAMHLKTSPGGKGLDFSYDKQGKDYVLMTSREEAMEIHLGGKSYGLALDEARIRDVRPEHLVTALAQSEHYHLDHPLNPYGRYFTSSPVGLDIELAYFQEKNEEGLHDILLKIVGAEAFNEGIDGKVVRYSASVASSGVNYSYTVNDREKNRLTTRDSQWYGNSFQLYVAGKTFQLVPQIRMNGVVKPRHLYTESKK